MTRFAHTNIVARDWRLLADFYRDVFDCVPVPPQRNQSGEWLDRGTGLTGAALEGMHLRVPGHGPDGPTLEIYTYSRIGEREPARANSQGFAHIAFEVDDVPAILARVLDRGGSALGEITVREVEGVGTITFVYLTDPEGNIIEVQNWSGTE